MSGNETIAVAMSGGVDSSVAAGLLARRGRRVLGFSMQLVDRLAGEEERYGRCCSPDDFRDARAVADRFGFPHYVLDLEDDFRRHVLQPFADDYAEGRTPSPCVRCNTFMKFGTLLARARAVGADRVATGHYAVLDRSSRPGRTLLRQAADRDKDQSYYLFDLSQAQLSRIEFPLGSLRKEEVREAARELGLGNADKPESQDLCFVARGEDYHEFLGRHGLSTETRSGDIVDGSGRVLGRHDGIERYTVGQRRGLGIASADRLYVIGIDAGSGTVQVGRDDELLRSTCRIERVRWIASDRPTEPVRASVRIRASHRGAEATITDHGDGTASVRFDEPIRAIAPGQAAVAYDGDIVLGGGWITASE